MLFIGLCVLITYYNAQKREYKCKNGFPEPLRFNTCWFVYLVMILFVDAGLVCRKVTRKENELMQPNFVWYIKIIFVSLNITCMDGMSEPSNVQS